NGGAHDARADQHDIECARVLGLVHKGPPLLSAELWVGDERHFSAWAKNHVCPAPGIVVDKFPAVPRTSGVLGKQDVARVQHEVLACARLEVERAAQCDDELAGRGIGPFEGSAGSRLAERDTDDINGTAQKVTAFTLGKVNHSLLEKRVIVVSGPKPNTANH